MRLVVGPTVLRECQGVIQRKNPTTLPDLAQLLASGLVETSQAPTSRQVDAAKAYVQYAPDAHVLAEAILAKPDWFVTHDKEHFLKHRSRIDLSFEIGTPGDVLQRYKDEFIQP
jgi:predicted nucleic acid-binding protein